MKGMKLELKLKETVLDIALNQALRTKHPSRKRIARNMVEMGLSLSKSTRSDSEKAKLEEDFSALFEEGDFNKIREWFLNNF